jgi:site-specific recombinase XerD
MKIEMKDLVNWSEQPLQRWMGTISKKRTAATYKSGYRFYQLYTGLTSNQLIDEALEDAKRDPREKTGILKQRLIGFYNWLIKEAPKRRTIGRGKTEVVDKGVSSKMAHCYVNAVRSFYSTFDVFVKLKGRSSLPKARVVNKRMLVSNMEVKRLVDNARNPRDRAIILTLFQSGMDVSTLCSLKYGDMTEGLSRNDHPLKLELYRQKSGTEFYTFIGRDTIEAVRAYINDVTARDLKFNPKTPLFLKESNKLKQREGIAPQHVQSMLKHVAMKAGFVDKHLNGKDFNPLSPHALRESFGSIMTGQGVPDTVVDFWLGHEIGELAEAYKAAKFEDVRNMYIEREQFISITPRTDIEEVKAKVREEISTQTRQLQLLVNGLSTENLELRKRVQKLERKQVDVEEILSKIEESNRMAKTLIEELEQQKRRN